MVFDGLYSRTHPNRVLARVSAGEDDGDDFRRGSIGARVMGYLPHTPILGEGSLGVSGGKFSLDELGEHLQWSGFGQGFLRWDFAREKLKSDVLDDRVVAPGIGFSYSRTTRDDAFIEEQSEPRVYIDFLLLEGPLQARVGVSSTIDAQAKADKGFKGDVDEKRAYASVSYDFESIGVAFAQGYIADVEAELKGQLSGRVGDMPTMIPTRVKTESTKRSVTCGIAVDGAPILDGSFAWVMGEYNKTERDNEQRVSVPILGERTFPLNVDNEENVNLTLGFGLSPSTYARWLPDKTFAGVTVGLRNNSDNHEIFVGFKYNLD